MEQLKVGDRVTAVQNCPEYLLGLNGTVVNVLGGVGVRHGVNIHGHDCAGKCEWGYGFWYFYPDIQFQRIDEPTTDISIDDLLTLL